MVLDSDIPEARRVRVGYCVVNPSFFSLEYFSETKAQTAKLQRRKGSTKHKSDDQKQKGGKATKRPGQKLLNKKQDLPSASGKVLPFLLAPSGR